VKKERAGQPADPNIRDQEAPNHRPAVRILAATAPCRVVLYAKQDAKNFTRDGKKALAMGIVLMYIPFHR
jgi:hypothetical protein